MTKSRHIREHQYVRCWKCGAPRRFNDPCPNGCDQNTHGTCTNPLCFAHRNDTPPMRVGHGNVCTVGAPHKCHCLGGVSHPCNCYESPVNA